MRETEHAAASTIRCRLVALSSLYKHLVRHDHAPQKPVGEVERPAINRDEGFDLGLCQSAGAQIARRAGRGHGSWLARSRDYVGRFAGGLARCRDRTRSWSATCTRTAACFVAGHAQGRPARGAGDQSANRRSPSRLSGGLGAQRRHRWAPVSATQAQRQPSGRAPTHGPPTRSTAWSANTPASSGSIADTWRTRCAPPPSPRLSKTARSLKTSRKPPRIATRAPPSWMSVAGTTRRRRRAFLLRTNGETRMAEFTARLLRRPLGYT